MHAKSLRSMCVLLLLTFLMSNGGPVKVLAYNLHSHAAVTLRDPQLLTQQPKTRSSYFGFSLVLRDNSIMIGAPRGQNPKKPPPGRRWSNEMGVVWRCSLSAQQCRPFDLQIADTNRITTNQWLASTMDGAGNTDDDMLAVCAPRFAYRNEDEMQGICYWSGDTRRNVINKVGSGEINTFLVQTLNREVRQTYWSHQGISLHVVQNSSDIMMGAIGTNLYKGAVVFHNTASNYFSIFTYKGDVFSYFGYAVASGNLGPPGADQKPSLLYVATAPRAFDAAGEAIVMDKTRIRAILNGTQYGEYFGYAALVADVNGDGMDDIMITAPQYAAKASQYDNGAVYVFLNKGDTNFERSRIVSPFADAGRFGTTICNLGDINLDGFNDVAVGAPFTQDSGAVAIYLGSANGLSTTPSQVLVGRGIVGGMFGHGLSRGVDIDGNGYNDLAVGAPEAESVYMYKAYPVVKIVATLQTKTLKLQRKLGEAIILEVCHRIETNSTRIDKRQIKLNFIIDVQLKRALFDGKTPSTEHEVIVEGSKTTQCFNVTASTVLMKMANRPLRVFMDYTLASTETPDPSVDKFCDSCAVVDPKQPHSLSQVIPFETDCGVYCSVEFKVSLLSAPTNVTLGIDKFIIMRYEVENSGQMSFDAVLNIEATTSMPFSKFPSMCTESTIKGGNMRNLSCDLAQSKEFQGKLALELIFDASSQVDEEELRVHVTIGSDSGVETNKEDNDDLHTVQVLRNSYVSLEGKPINNYMQLKTDSEVQQMQYDIKILNQGPSALTKQRLFVRFPVAFQGPTDKQHLRLVNTTTMHLYTTAEGGNARYLDLKLLDEDSSLDTPTDTADYDFIANNQRVLACRNTTNVLCVQAEMDLELASGGEMAMSLTYEVIAAAAEALTKNYDYLVLLGDVQLESRTPVMGNIEQSKNIEATIIVNLKPQETPLWVYVVSVIGGFLSLVPVIWGLRKANFFKRQTQEDMEEILQKKAMKAKCNDT